MRALGLLLGLTLLGSGAAAGDKAALWTALSKLDASASLSAYEFAECAEAAARDGALRDTVTPSQIMAETVATEAAKQCDAGNTQAEAIKAIVHRLNVETALAVRRGEPLMVCAVGRHPCGSM
jgi:hypothetical protein